MGGDMLLFWKTGPGVRLSAAEIGRDLIWGEDVEGLIDLPIKEILDRVKAEFPNHREQAGSLTVDLAGGSLEITWTWQHLRVECHDVPPAERQRLIELVESLDCTAFDPQFPGA